MKTKEFQQSLKKLNVQQLVDLLAEQSRTLFSTRVNRLTSHVKDFSQFNKLRKNIARLKTEIRARQRLMEGV